ncbi:MAG: alpha/beta fold hydrolase [Betaproteobacteria bacterium]
MPANILIPFAVPYADRIIKGDRFHGRLPLQTLLIHGAGASERGRFAPLRSTLHGCGIGTTAFDCVGHGETGGALHESSLCSRTRQAEAVINAPHSAVPRAVVGTSMGAYNAIKLLETQALEALILVVPGVYTPEAYDIPFGSGFSAVIRQERSWEQSDAWGILRKFTGRLLVIAAEHDTVIPREIPERLFQSAHQASWRKLCVVPGAEHNRLFSLLAERPIEFEKTMDLILDCLDPAV